jgi:tryptophan-rich sensory protein
MTTNMTPDTPTRGAVNAPAPMTPLSLQKQALGLAAWLAVTFLAGATGALASVRAAAFYGQLVQPSWAPPAWLFGPVWSALYVMMGIAAWLVWRAHGWPGAATALRLFVAQLIANALWTWVFFDWRLGALAMAEIAVLWALIAGAIVAFWRLHRVAALMLLPYLGWVSFASALTFSLWRGNLGVLG